MNHYRHGITRREIQALRTLLHFAVPQLDLIENDEAHVEVELACAVLTSALERMKDDEEAL